MPNGDKGVFEFGPFRLNAAEHTLFRAGALVDLTPKEVDLLMELVQNSGHVLEKNHLIAKVWPDTNVAENNLLQQVSTLRRKLGNQEDGEPYIRTIPRRGYCFWAKVTNQPDLGSVDGVPHDVSTAGLEERKTTDWLNKSLPAGLEPTQPGRLAVQRENWRIAGLIAGLIAVASAVLLATRTSDAERASQMFAHPALAVLGFRNSSGQVDTSWLSTAFSEMFRTQLAVRDRLRPISGEEIARAQRELSLPDADSFSKETLARIRKDLGADLVLVGSYIDIAGKIHLNLVLQDARNGRTLAAFPENGTESMLFQMVAHAGGVLATQLGVSEALSSQTADIKPILPRSLDAQRLYAQGLEHLQRLEATAAKDLLQEAVQAEPSYALGHAALADAWSVLGYEAKAAEEARAAVELSSNLAPEEALIIEARYRELAKEWERAIEIYQTLCKFSPNDLEDTIRLARAEISAGRGREALATMSDRRRRQPQVRDDPRTELVEALAAESLGDFSQEETVAAKAAQKAEGRGAKLLVASARLRECWALYKLGRPRQAIENAQQARQIFASVEDRGGEAQALQNIADVLDDEGSHVQASKLYEQALFEFRAIGRQTGVAIVLNNLAYALKSQGDLASAKQRFEESLGASREISDQGLQALALNGIGTIAWREGDLTEAKTVFEQALVIHRERGDKNRAATVLNNIALVAEDQGVLADAANKLEESLQLIRATGDRSGEARTLGNLGDVLLKQGSLSAAKKSSVEQLALGRAIKDDRQVAYAFYRMGEILRAEGDLAGAKTNHQKALELRVTMGESGIAAESRAALAELALEEENPRLAETLAQEAGTEFQKEQELDEAACANALLARALLAEGKSANAVQVIKLAQERSSKSQDRAVRLEIAITAARIRAHVGHTEDSLTDLQMIQAEAKKYGYVGYELQASFALCEGLAKSHRVTAHDQLAALEKEARSKGYGLIARKAAWARLKAERL